MTTRDEAVARLTAPGARFEVVTDRVLDEPMQVFAHRHRSLRELLELSAAHGEAEYLVTRTRRITFAEHLAEVSALATALRLEHGVRPGDRVAICAANGPEWIVTFWATVSLGAVAVGMNSLWAPPEIAHALDLVEPRVVVVDGPRRALLGPVDVPVLTVESDVPALVDRFRGAELPLLERALDEDDPAVVLFTSGTSGRPKGATHSHRNVLCAVWFHLFNDALAGELGHPPLGRRFLLATPLFHIAALHNLAVVRLAVGDTAVIHQGRFDVAEVLGLIQDERVTNWGAVPTMLTRVVDLGDRVADYDLSSLRTVTVNSAPSSPTLKQRLDEVLPVAGRNLGTSYGLTESSTAATVAGPLDLIEDPATVGRGVLTLQIEVRGPDGAVLPDGTEGEICLRGPQVMLGYWRDPVATAESCAAGGWFRTGDLGSLHEGRLRIATRRSDLILRGGENVYPAEVENRLMTHPGVRECSVIGLPDADLGQAVAAVVVLHETSDADVAELERHTRDGLARYKVPTRWALSREPLPRNATGKVVRADLSRRVAGPDEEPLRQG